MPLSTAKYQLLNELKEAFKNAKTKGTDLAKKQQDPSDIVIEQLALDMSAAIDNYVRAAQVNITSVVSTVPPGVAVATAGTPAAQTGATVSPGVAQHSGFGTLQ